MPRYNRNLEMNSIEAFALEEYKNISQAHYNTVTSISSFFQYYILIVSLPISAAVALGKLGTATAVMGRHPLATGLISVIIFVALAGIVAYITNLRADAILYARAVNGIRKYFFDRAGFDLKDEFRIRMLPTNTHFPRYYESRYFIFVILTFALLNSLVATIGWWWYFEAKHISSSWFFLIMAAGVSLHFALYHYLAQHRERSYLHGHIIGVDIDGVLGKRRQQFCQILKRESEIDIDPESIVTIPVHECPNLDISEANENEVFNNPEYWSGMPLYEDAGYVLTRLKDIHHYKIWVFSWRDWPTVSGMDMKSKRSLLDIGWLAALKSIHDEPDDQMEAVLATNAVLAADVVSITVAGRRPGFELAVS